VVVVVVDHWWWWGAGCGVMQHGVVCWGATVGMLLLHSGGLIGK
jgi:hypothetical protein